MGELNLRETVLARIRESKPQYEEHDFAGLGKVFVKRLNAGEKDRYEKASQQTVGRAVTVAHCCFDERGARIFSDDDVIELEQMDPTLTDPIVKAALRINGYTEADQAELLKNSNGQAVSS